MSDCSVRKKNECASYMKNPGFHFLDGYADLRKTRAVLCDVAQC